MIKYWNLNLICEFVLGSVWFGMVKFWFDLAFVDKKKKKSFHIQTNKLNNYLIFINLICEFVCATKNCCTSLLVNQNNFAPGPANNISALSRAGRSIETPRQWCWAVEWGDWVQLLLAGMFPLTSPLRPGHRVLLLIPLLSNDATFNLTLHHGLNPA